MCSYSGRLGERGSGFMKIQVNGKTKMNSEYVIIMGGRLTGIQNKLNGIRSRNRFALLNDGGNIEWMKENRSALWECLILYWWHYTIYGLIKKKFEVSTDQCSPDIADQKGRGFILIFDIMKEAWQCNFAFFQSLVLPK